MCGGNSVFPLTASIFPRTEEQNMFFVVKQMKEDTRKHPANYNFD